MMSALRRMLAPLKSRKVRTALTTVIVAYLGQRWSILDGPTVYVLLGVGVTLILGTALEDAGRKASGREYQPPGEDYYLLSDEGDS
jgi:hypothetical protein